LVLALPIEQTLNLLDSLSLQSQELGATQALLRVMSSVPCLTVLAGYHLNAPEPSWDVSYPEDSPSLLLISHDSAKRRKKRFHALVYQCRTGFSRRHLSEEPTTWGEQVLAEAARRLGTWAAQPLWSMIHRWRYARAEPAGTLAGPMLLDLGGGGKLGLAGEVFAPGGGVEAAWLSGRRLARRILGESKE
jgi:predicted NAD/FAD-dependent oxidoreductase